MTIGEAARRSGVSAKMIRYYESIGLLPAAGRTGSGYRDYGGDDIARLSFVRKARDLGFSMERIRGLMALWANGERSNADVRALALDHVRELEDRAAHLQEMIATLRQLVADCAGQAETECPIIAELGDHRPAPPCAPAPARRPH